METKSPHHPALANFEEIKAIRRALGQRVPTLEEWIIEDEKIDGMVRKSLGMRPGHPLDEIIAKVRHSQWQRRTGELEGYEITMQIYLASRHIVDPSPMSPLEFDELQMSIGGLGMWLIERFLEKDPDALRRLAKCWDYNPYDDGAPTKKGGDKSRGRKDLLDLRNKVIIAVLKKVISSGDTFTDGDMKLLSEQFGGPKGGVSDETIKKWKTYIGPIGMEYHRAKRPGPQKRAKVPQQLIR